MVATSSQHGPVDSEHVEIWWGQFCNTRQKGISVIETARYKSIWGNSEYATDPGYGKTMTCRLLIYISRRWIFFVKNCSQDSVHILLSCFWHDLNRKHREIIGPLLFVTYKEEFSFVWNQFQFIQDWTEAGHDCNHSVMQEQESRLVQRTHTAGYHQHRRGEG